MSEAIIQVCAYDLNKVDVCVDNLSLLPEKSVPILKVRLFQYPQRTCLCRYSMSEAAVQGSCGMSCIFLVIFAITLESLSVPLVFVTPLSVLRYTG
jgi:hypothetical protein